jgi:hypothetical protein
MERQSCQTHPIPRPLRRSASLKSRRHRRLQIELAAPFISSTEPQDGERTFATLRVGLANSQKPVNALLLEVFMVKLKKRQRIASVVAAGDKTAKLLKAFMDNPPQYRKPAMN